MAPLRILVVCTGNICRSPVAERLLRSALAECPGETVVESAGTRARVGRPMEPGAVRVLDELGVAPDPTFGSRPLHAAHVAAADLVLTAERAHREAVARLDRSAWQRAFTLVEFARLVGPAEAGALGEQPRHRPDRLGVRGRALVAHAAAHRALVPPARPEDDDVEDPIGASVAVFRRSGGRIADAVAAIAAGLTGVPSAVSAAPARRRRLRWPR